ncbi:helix-turn-helix domain-containing protein [Phenylobacterium sp.]|jgi:HTH-type transcriptional regulator/antitoxin HipB|uniref:helix-turn-helix domain-containing protein n=1 Tax=Phenylobacterium sp. TaxID=1871053 RepID=UPI002E2FCD5F|nr:helix-turn-helix domain-containing protein [Phenylobacterium sp.]HEX3363918.1 helix-turn-helix domain-containing protein [Phenylobacterium sp.]
MDQATRTQAQLGAYLRRARKTKGLTQDSLAEQINKRQATVSNLESPEGGATLETLFAVLSALDLELVVRPRTKGNRDSLGDIF